MSSFDLFPVEIKRAAKTKQPDLSYTETFGPIPGSPAGGWPCRYYRKKQNYRSRDEATPGTATIDTEQVLSVQAPGADIRTGDIVVLPAGTVSSQAERALVRRTRSYVWGIQCDIETGAQGAA